MQQKNKNEKRNQASKQIKMKEKENSFNCMMTESVCSKNVCEVTAGLSRSSNFKFFNGMFNQFELENFS